MNYNCVIDPPVPPDQTSKVISRCSLCGTSPIGRGYSHICTEATMINNLKAQVLSEKPVVRERIAAAVLRDKMIVGKCLIFSITPK